ncbi:MAG: hypothetical protein HOJ35_08625 [Bdellovibrionales bacterium]|nr:hypothetical protein [Bdellovibrionales bacterium]
MNHFVKSIVEAIKSLTKIAITFFGLLLSIAGGVFIYVYVKEATSSEFIASIVGLTLIALVYKFGGKILDKLFNLKCLKEGGKDDYERATYRSTWGEIIGYAAIALVYGGVILSGLSIVIPNRLIENIWSDNSIINFFIVIGVGTLVGLVINIDFRETVKNWFK